MQRNRCDCEPESQRVDGTMRSAAVAKTQIPNSAQANRSSWRWSERHSRSVPKLDAESEIRPSLRRASLPTTSNHRVRHAKSERDERDRISLSERSSVRSDAAIMVKRLLVAGSNSGYQLGVAHDQDVRTFQEALCQIDGQHETVCFPPVGFTVTEISSGANHTLSLLQALQDEHGAPIEHAPRQVWATGTGTQGQLGPAHASAGSKPMEVFTRLDLATCLNGLVGLPQAAALLEPSHVLCGWNCSFVVLTPRAQTGTDPLGQDLLISLGSHGDNAFGELGAVASVTADGDASCVHAVSFAGVLAEAGLDASVPLRIVHVAAGLRHTVAVLNVKEDAHGPTRTIVAGWGSARHGQVGRVPNPSTLRRGAPKRPGPAAAVVPEPQLIFDWKTERQCKVQAGRDHTVVLVKGKDGEKGGGLHSIGSNKQGQLPDASALPAHATSSEGIADVACNWTSTHLLLKQKDDPLARPFILSCGSNSRGQLGNGSKTSTPAGSSLTPVDLTTLSSPALPASSNDAPVYNSSLTDTLMLKKLVSGSEHSLLLVVREMTMSDCSHRLSGSQVWGWGWNEHGNLAQGEHDEADRDRPVLLFDGTRSGAAQPKCTPLDVWAGCGTTFILVEQHVTT